MRESEDLRWMGPARYDIAGCMVFLKHKYDFFMLQPSWTYQAIITVIFS